MEQELIKSPFHSSASPTIPAIVLQTGEERWDGRCLLFGNTLSLSPSLDFGVMRAYHLSLSLSGKGEHYLLYCGGIKFMTTKTPFLPSEKAVFDV